MDEGLTIYDNLGFPFKLQQITAISPYIRKGNTLRTSLISTTYSYAFLLTYLGSVALSFYFFEDYTSIHLSDGYLWRIIIYFEIVFTNIVYPILLVALERKKQQQMWFISAVHEWDEMCRYEFQTNFTQIYNNLHFYQCTELIFCILYFSLLLLIFHIRLIALRTYTFSAILFSFTYIMEQFSIGVLTWVLNDSVRIILSKFDILHQIQRSNFPVMQTNKSNDKILFEKRKLVLILKAFKKLCYIIDVLSGELGSLVIILIAHDFTLVTSQCYMIYWIIFYNTVNDKTDFVVSILLWMIQNFIKLSCISITCQRAINKVSVEVIYCELNKITHLFLV